MKPKDNNAMADHAFQKQLSAAPEFSGVPAQSAGESPPKQTGSLGQSGENARLILERDFLLARAGHAGSAYFGRCRWTGVSSNALVTVAFGGECDELPWDRGDLAACYRTVMRLPDHLRTDAVLAQLKRGEDYVEGKYPGSIAWARAEAEYPSQDHPA